MAERQWYELHKSRNFYSYLAWTGIAIASVATLYGSYKCVQRNFRLKN